MNAVLDRRLNECGVNKAADEHNQHGDGVGPPKVACFIRVLNLALFFLLIKSKEFFVDACKHCCISYIEMLHKNGDIISFQLLYVLSTCWHSTKD